jgi:hypothetical protein
MMNTPPGGKRPFLPRAATRIGNRVRAAWPQGQGDQRTATVRRLHSCAGDAAREDHDQASASMALRSMHRAAAEPRFHLRSPLRDAIARTAGSINQGSRPLAAGECARHQRCTRFLEKVWRKWRNCGGAGTWRPACAGEMYAQEHGARAARLGGDAPGRTLQLAGTRQPPTPPREHPLSPPTPTPRILTPVREWKDG